MKDNNDLSSFDFGDSLMSPKNRDTTDLQDFIREYHTTDGCLDFDDSPDVLKMTADEFEQDAERKHMLRDWLYESDAHLNLADAIACSRESEIEGLINNLKRLNKDNIESAVTIVALEGL